MRAQALREHCDSSTLQALTQHREVVGVQTLLDYVPHARLGTMMTESHAPRQLMTTSTTALAAARWQTGVCSNRDALQEDLQCTACSTLASPVICAGHWQGQSAD